jgi:hypothetical protein
MSIDTSPTPIEHSRLMFNSSQTLSNTFLKSIHESCLILKSLLTSINESSLTFEHARSSFHESQTTIDESRSKIIPKCSKNFDRAECKKGKRARDYRVLGAEQTTRKPMLLARVPASTLRRVAERQPHGRLPQEPPRTTLRVFSRSLPISQTRPSTGAFI